MTVHSKSFDTPDEQRTPDKTQVDVVRLPGATVARLTFRPGWQWSECVRPVVGGDSCQVRHVGALLSGRMEVVHDDGTKAHVEPGTAYVIEPGHDARVVGDEPLVALEFESHAAETYAKA
ncbi:MAG TPA: cupin domain-containing protein [Nocardioides sp.]|nr:cupin domain-containing protein [Nocardioides sp.]